MDEDFKICWIPADLHKWLKRLAVENDSTLQEEHNKALREVYRQRMTAGTGTQAQPQQPVRA
jgi:shikimate kinase